jgi:hypothetical protein
LWAREWGIQPGEFWSMTMGEWWAEYQLKAPAPAGEKLAGKLTADDVDDLKAWMEAKDNGDSRD